MEQMGHDKGTIESEQKKGDQLQREIIDVWRGMVNGFGGKAGEIYRKIYKPCPSTHR